MILISNFSAYRLFIFMQKIWNYKNQKSSFAIESHCCQEQQVRVCIYCSFCFCLCCFHLSEVHYKIFVFNFIFLFQYLPSLMHAFCFSNHVSDNKCKRKLLGLAQNLYEMLIWHIIQYMMPYCSATLRRCPRAIHSSPPLMGLWQPCPTSVSMTTATKTALTRSEACFCHPKHSAFCHVFPKILLARHFVRWWGLWSATRLFTADIMAEVDWSRVTTQRKDKTLMRSLWYYNYFSNKTIGKAKGDCQWKSNQTGVCCFLNTSHCE